MELELSLGDSPARLKVAVTPPCAAEGEAHDDLVLGLGVRAEQGNQRRREPHHEEEEEAVEEEDDKTCSPGVSLSCPADLHPTSAQAEAGSANSEVSSRLGVDVTNTVEQQLAVDHGVDSEDEEYHGGGCRVRKKKLRLSKEQSAFLDNSFRQHSTLSMEQKCKLADRLSLRRRQVEVWFQNRRARTKLKQTEVEREQLKRSCETLAQENGRLRREVAELRRRALRPAFPLYSDYHHPPAVVGYSPPVAATHAAVGTSPTPSTTSTLVCSAAGSRRQIMIHGAHSN